ncbi:MAG TPA: AtpZ/AtpI family protein [Actinomycetota bacterium]|nr:AtpZ/AtpI family protein [Actinomycetota bacterium]
MTPSRDSRELYRAIGEGWSAVSYIITGVLLWGGLGMLLDRAVGTGRVFTVVGALVGNFAGIYLMYRRFVAESEAK